MTEDYGIAVSVPEARACIDDRKGFKVDSRSGCWLWRWPAPSGFGPFLSFYSAAYGNVPEDLEVVHICSGGPRGCVKPSHLDIVPKGSQIARVLDRAITLDEKLEFAGLIRDERRARRAPRTQFAEELGVSPSTLRDWEEGVSTPLPDTYERISKRMGWDGLLRRFEVVVVVERIEFARSAGQAVRRVVDQLTPEGQPDKIEVVRANVRA